MESAFDSKCVNWTENIVGRSLPGWIPRPLPQVAGTVNVNGEADEAEDSSTLVNTAGNPNEALSAAVSASGQGEGEVCETGAHQDRARQRDQ